MTRKGSELRDEGSAVDIDRDTAMTGTYVSVIVVEVVILVALWFFGRAFS